MQKKSGEFMVQVREDLTGKTFGRLTVLERADDYIDPHGKPWPMWKCICSCDEHKIVIVRGRDLKCSHTTSCGCVHKEKTIEQGHKNKKYNEWSDKVFTDEHGSYRIGFTSNTHKEFYIDTDDYDKIYHITWAEHYFDNMSHLEGWDPASKRMVRMHIFLGYKYYDHADRNELNNRKYNLRQATPNESACNRKISNKSTGFTGVSKRENGKYRAILTKDHKKVLDKTFDTFEKAKIARIRAEKEFHKEFAIHKDLFKELDSL